MDAASAEWAERRVMVVLSALVGDASEVIDANLAGLTDEEYFWEPAPGAWGVRRRGDVRSPDCWGKGEWAVEHCFDGSQSLPTTIGWRLMHAYDCTADFTSRAFGHGGRDWNEIEVAGDAGTAVAMMSDAMATLRRELDSATDDVLLGPGEPDYDRPRWYALDKALHESIHHCAEIGVLRTMYALRP
jgi:hypothetical protein